MRNLLKSQLGYAIIKLTIVLSIVYQRLFWGIINKYFYMFYYHIFRNELKEIEDRSVNKNK